MRFSPTHPGCRLSTVDLPGDTAYSVTLAYQNCACGFHVPTAFTPNNDGINDIFLPKNECPFSNYEVKVFDRWGKMIFVSRSAAAGWDGTVKSQLQPSGTYVWELVYKDGPTGNTVLEKGTLVLMR
jgi:gliding motility-associated-like protein